MEGPTPLISSSRRFDNLPAPLDSFVSYFVPAAAADWKLSSLILDVKLNIRAVAFSVPWIPTTFSFQHRNFTIGKFMFLLEPSFKLLAE
jgi:hypothetical protein